MAGQIFKSTSFLILATLLFSSCNYEINKTTAGDVATFADTPPEKITFEMVRENVLVPKCLMCHSNTDTGHGINKGKVNLDTYANVFAKRESIRDEVQARTMPKRAVGPLSDAQLNLILKWIDAGTLENGKPQTPPPSEPSVPVTNPTTPTPPPPATEPVTPPITTPPTTPPPAPEFPAEPLQLNFANVMKYVIQPKCLKCHAQSGRNDVKLETYEDVVENRFEAKSDVEDDSMPRKDKLTPQQKKLILDWFEAGFPKE